MENKELAKFKIFGSFGKSVKEEEDAIITHPTTASGNLFAVLIQSAVVSQKFQVTVEWFEWN